MKLTDRLQHAWNAFKGDNHEEIMESSYGITGGRPGHLRRANYSTSSFAASIFNRIAIDVATTTFEHISIDKDGDREERKKVDSGLNYCLQTEANLDQTATAFIHDIVYSMFDEGVVAVVPVETSSNPKITNAYEIHSMRVGKIVDWYPKHVRVELYNEDTGNMEEVYLSKDVVAIIENPLYPVTNSENSVLKRLMRKMNEIDNIDEAIASGRLDLLIQLPYAIKSEAQERNAKKRIKHIEAQLKSNNHGLAYIDGTEKITQLNRPVNDQLLESVEKLTQDFYNQLGLTENIFNGTAREEEVRVYYSRTIDPIIEYIIEEFDRKFLTKTARTRGHKVEAYRDMFKFVSINALADMSDKFRRNSILTTNEIREIMRLPQSHDPRADELYNPNMPDDDQGMGVDPNKVKEDHKYSPAEDDTDVEEGSEEE